MGCVAGHDLDRPKLFRQAAAVVSAVRTEGDAAVRRYTQQFGGSIERQREITFKARAVKYTAHSYHAVLRQFAFFQCQVGHGIHWITYHDDNSFG